jgi:transposase
MRKIKEVLRLRFELGLGLRQIARSCSVSRAAVTDYLQRAEAAGLGWPLPDACNEEELERKLFRRPAVQPTLRRAVPDFAQIHEQLQRHKHVTLQLLWQEYREANPDGYRYSFFCELYRQWHRKWL